MTLAWGGRRYETDKYPELIHAYDAVLAPLRHQPIVLLELGVAKGGSLLFWRDYFPQGLIAGVDDRPVTVEDASGRVRVYRGAQQDVELLDRIAGEVAPDGFSVIIDDASHVGEHARVSFWHLFPRHLRPGGVYAIEDWGTGYWERWEDGERWRPAPDSPLCGTPPRPSPGAPVPRQFPSHQGGMVGFIKELIDEVGVEDATREGLAAPAARTSLIEVLHVRPALVIAIRSDRPPLPDGV